ncbi:3-oxoadipate enol-lactonase [Paracoccus aerodenitrificans]|uniref:3-oxoadipate enol-lactonase n=1 Tax=Paracoccus aerodenitrificans TaxID=3017781 RepID=UPI0022F0202A|nr:3-oxoadipate enol-lactonase [Paracoccus aerodenitrificans]WBU64197.1 3-oxoadipate enol-lactonase [Paracoccus aerodenitrificans]
MQIIDANGIGIHYADHGPENGKAVVFSNSLGTDLRLWDALLPHLPEGLRLVRYDKRGHGLSEETQGPYSIEQLADDAAGLIDGLGLKDVVFVGLSIGGLIGQGLALRRPDLLKALVISNSAAKIGTDKMWNDRVAAIREGGLEVIAAPTMERWFSPDFRATPELAVWQRMLERQPMQGYIACCQAIAAADLRRDVEGLDLPVQMIAGSLDGSTPPELVKATGDLMPGAAYAEIDGAGHLPCVEAASRYADILNGFLKEVGHV